MIRRRALIAKVTVALLVTAAMVIPTQAVAAGPPSPASGTVISTSAVLTAPPRSADDNLFLEQHETLVIAGTIMGSIDQQESIVVHLSDGTAEVQGFGTITGTFGSCGTGTVPIEITARFTPAAGLTGHLVSIDRSNNTLGVHLNLDVSSAGPGFAYSGFIFCGP